MFNEEWDQVGEYREYRRLVGTTLQPAVSSLEEFEDLLAELHSQVRKALKSRDSLSLEASASLARRKGEISKHLYRISEPLIDVLESSNDHAKAQLENSYLNVLCAYRQHGQPTVTLNISAERGVSLARRNDTQRTIGKCQSVCEPWDECRPSERNAFQLGATLIRMIEDGAGLDREETEAAILQCKAAVVELAEKSPVGQFSASFVSLCFLLEAVHEALKGSSDT